MAVPDEHARPLSSAGGVPGAAPPVARPLRTVDDDPTVTTRVMPRPPRDRALWRRVRQLCTDLDQVYFDGRHAALAADDLSLVAGVLRALEGGLARLHRLVVRTRALSAEREDLLAADGDRLEAHLVQCEGYRREILGLTSACRRLHQEKCALENQLRDTTRRVAAQSAGRMETAHLVARCRELEQELAVARRHIARAEQRLAVPAAGDEALRLRLAAAEAQLAELEHDNDRLVRERDELHADLAAARTELITRVRRAG